MSARVYRSYNQTQLDEQYNQRTLVPDLKGYFDRWQRAAKTVEQSLVVKTGVVYGEHPAEWLDVIEPHGPARKLHVHYHGGAWRALNSRDAWFVSPPWVAEGYTFVSVNFALVPDVTLSVQVNQARRALAWCSQHACELEIDPGQITVSGHSSGAYLAAMVGLVEWGREQPDVQAVIIASGVYDLVPVQLSARNDYLSLSEAEASDLSPVNLLRQETAPCCVLWSVRELDEFQRQSAAYAEMLSCHGHVECRPVDVSNHFETWDLVTPQLLEDLVRG